MHPLPHTTHVTTAAKPRWVDARTGARSTLLDLDTGEPEPVVGRIRKLLDQLAPVAVDLGAERELARASVLTRACGADRQKQVVHERGSDVVDWQATQILTSARRRPNGDARPNEVAPALAVRISSGKDRK